MRVVNWGRSIHTAMARYPKSRLANPVIPSARHSARARVHRARCAAIGAVFAGLRIHHPIELRWRDVDLAVARSPCGAKDGCGLSTIDVPPVLHDTLAALKAARNPSLRDWASESWSG
jgi:hypothetical protein